MPRHQGLQKGQRSCKKNKSLIMVDRVVRVYKFLMEKLVEDPIPQDKRRPPSLLLENMLGAYSASWTLLFGSLMISYCSLAMVLYVPLIMIAKAKLFYDLVMSSIFFFIVISWSLGGFVSRIEATLRSHNTGIGELVIVFLNNPVVCKEEKDILSHASVMEELGKGVTTPTKEEEKRVAYDEKVEREWVKLLEVIERYKDLDTIYLGNDFLNSIASENLYKLEKKGYNYWGNTGRACHKISMDKPSSCIIF